MLRPPSTVQCTITSRLEFTHLSAIMNWIFRTKEHNSSPTVFFIVENFLISPSGSVLHIGQGTYSALGLDVKLFIVDLSNIWVYQNLGLISVITLKNSWILQAHLNVPPARPMLHILGGPNFRLCSPLKLSVLNFYIPSTCQEKLQISTIFMFFVRSKL